MDAKTVAGLLAVLAIVPCTPRAAADMPWKTNGNLDTNPDYDFLGTINNLDLVLRTSNLERLRILNTGEAQFASDVAVAGNTDLSLDLTVGGNTSLALDLIVGGNSDFAGNVSIGGDVDIQSDLILSGYLGILGTNAQNDVPAAGYSFSSQGYGIPKAAKASAGPGFPQAPLHVQAVGPFDGNHVAIFESIGSASADGIAIMLANSHTNRDNNFVTFYNGSGTVTGRIEGFDLENGDWQDPPPLPTVGLGFTPPTFNSDFVDINFSGGSLPGLDIDFGVPPSFDFDHGSLPTLNFSLKPPFTFSEFPFSVTLPTQQEIEDLVCWSLENDIGDFLTLDPVSLAAAAIKVAASQICMDEGITYGTHGADYAEWLEKVDPQEHLQFGQLVGVHGGKVSLKTEGAEHVLAVSAKPAVLGNAPPPGREAAYEKIAMVGQVPVVVRGRVNPGDFIVPSGLNDGTAVAIAPDQLRLEQLPVILGRAWSGSTNDIYGFINVAVGVKGSEIADILARFDERLMAVESAGAVARDAEIDTLRHELEVRHDELCETQAELEELRAEVADLRNLTERLARLEGALEETAVASAK